MAIDRAFQSTAGTPDEMEQSIVGIDDSESPDAHVRPSWPPRPNTFGDLMTPVEAAQYLRLDETGQHTPRSAIRTLNY